MSRQQEGKRQNHCSLRDRRGVLDETEGLAPAALGHVSRPVYRLCFSLWLKPSLGLRLRPKLFMEQPTGNWQGGDLARPEFSSGAFS